MSMGVCSLQDAQPSAVKRDFTLLICVDVRVHSAEVTSASNDLCNQQNGYNTSFKGGLATIHNCCVKYESLSVSSRHGNIYCRKETTSLQGAAVAL